MVHEDTIFNDDIIDQDDAVIEANQAEPFLNEEQIRISEEVLNSFKEVSLIEENHLIPRCTRMYFLHALRETGKHAFLTI